MANTSPTLRGLLPASGAAWRGGGPLVLTFSFATDGTDELGNYLNDSAWAPFSAVQQSAARQALEGWAAATGLTFLEVPDTAGGAGIDLRFRLEDLGGPGVLGRATGPGDGDIALNLTLFRGDSLAPHATRIGFTTLLHEIGHAIGLEHPEAGTTRDESIMSATAGRLPLPDAPRPLDTQAASALYGTQAQEAAEGQHWSWDAEAGMVRGSGTAGADRLIGTDLADRLEAGGGADTIEGGGGIDTLVLGFARAQVALDLAAGTLATPGGGSIHFVGIERIEVTDGQLVLDADAAAARMLRLYELVLDRAPEAAGLGHWTLALERGLDLDQVADAFLHSREFALRFGSGLDDAGLARRLAANLDAPELADDIAAELAAAGSAGRAAVVAELAEGAAARTATAAELTQGIWDTHAAAGEIADLFHLALGRSPDAPGWTRWSEAMAEGTEVEAVAAALLQTREFRAHHGNPGPAALVPVLLENALGHPPSAAEATPWLARVAAAGLDGPGLLLAMAADPTLTAHFVPVVHEGMLYA